MRLAATKIVQLVIVLLAVTFLTTLLMSLFRGDENNVLCSLLGPNCGDPERAAALSDQLHLNENVFSRWLLWLGDALQGDFGRSGNSPDTDSTTLGTWEVRLSRSSSTVDSRPTEAAVVNQCLG